LGWFKSIYLADTVAKAIYCRLVSGSHLVTSFSKEVSGNFSLNSW